MKIIENHFQNKNTYFVGNFCINGCQCFTLDEADEVFKKYNVPIALQQDVRDNLPQADWVMSDYYDFPIERIIAAHKSTPPSILARLSTKTNNATRMEVARNPNTSVSVLKTLSKDEYWGVRYTVSRNSNTPFLLMMKLKKDGDFLVRDAASRALFNRTFGKWFR